MAANLKETLYTLADRLSDNATWDDVMEEVRFCRAVGNRRACGRSW